MLSPGATSFVAMHISFGSCPFTIGGMPRLVDLSAPIVSSPAETGAETLAVACPFCTVMLDDGMREAGAELRVADVSTLLAESLDG